MVSKILLYKRMGQFTGGGFIRDGGLCYYYALFEKELKLSW